MQITYNFNSSSQYCFNCSYLESYPYWEDQFYCNCFSDLSEDSVNIEYVVNCDKKVEL